MKIETAGITTEAEVPVEIATTTPNGTVNTIGGIGDNETGAEMTLTATEGGEHTTPRHNTSDTHCFTMATDQAQSPRYLFMALIIWARVLGSSQFFPEQFVMPIISAWAKVLIKGRITCGRM